jgi:hypothetical protein
MLPDAVPEVAPVVNVPVPPVGLAKFTITPVAVFASAGPWICASVAFDVRPENVSVHENVFAVGFKVPVNVPVAVVVTAVGLSFAPTSVAV